MLDLSNEKQAHIDERLRGDLIIWLSTVRPDGRPHSVAVWFLWDGTDITIFSIPNNQKVRNIRQNPQVFLALDDTKLGEDVITLEGTAALVTDSALTPVLPAYAQKYGPKITELGWSPETMASQYSQAIRITVTKVR